MNRSEEKIEHPALPDRLVVLDFLPLIVVPNTEVVRDVEQV